jgi:phosphate transport system permease protein
VSAAASAIHPANPRYRARKRVNAALLLVSGMALAFGLFWLAWILGTLLYDGGTTLLDLSFYMRSTPPPQERGGMLNAFFGSALNSAMAIAIGTPVGVLAGTYLAEYANHTRLGNTIRFVNDILLSAPSIVLGMFVATLIVVPMGHSSAYAGAIALALIGLPVIVRTTDEMLRLVPAAMREAALSLGVPQWKVTLQVLYRSALPGIVTGVLLALARITGETAPLLFTAYNNTFWSTDLNAPMANVPMVIFQYAMSPYESWNAIAWAGAFVVTIFVLLLGIAARALLLRNKAGHD